MRGTDKLFLFLILIVAGCSSGGLRIVETGFTAVETSPSRFVVKLESDEIRTADEAEANLLVHSARWTIDHSGFYFTLTDRIRGSESQIDLDKESTEESGVGIPTAASTSSGGYTSSTTGKRHTEWSMRATLRIYRDKPENAEGTVYEATRVLDQFRPLTKSSHGGSSWSVRQQ